jgi:Metallo-beta-lactamase superfamily
LLRLTFAESGVGETIFIEFPTGEVAVVDSHPSSSNCRPDIENEIGGRPVAFVCLTHPHEDHGLGLIGVLKKAKVQKFWHSMTEVEAFVNFVIRIPKFRSPLAPLAEKVREGRAKFMLDLWSTLKCRGIDPLSFDDSREAEEVGEVKIHFLAPSRDFLTKEFKRLHRYLQGKGPAPDPNRFSLVLGLEYRGTLSLLGGDALKAGWGTAFQKWHKKGLPKAIVLKIPHHGGANAFDLGTPTKQNRRSNCWDLCVEKPIGIIFAGDFKHPDPRILEELETRTDLNTFFDLRANDQRLNSFGLRTLGARAVAQPLRPQTFCKIIVEIDGDGRIRLIRNP